MDIDLGTNPASTAYQPCGLDKVSLSLGASVSSSVKWGNSTCCAFPIGLC